MNAPSASTPLAMAAILLLSCAAHAAPADRWDSNGPALISSKIKTCLTLHSSKCGQESYYDCATEHGAQTEIDQGFCVGLAYDVWLRLIDQELNRPGRGQAWLDEGKAAQAAWLAWSDHSCRMRTMPSLGGTSHSRLLTACKIDNAELWLRQLGGSSTIGK